MIQLHQALFGYQDGHRLLASSLVLPPQAVRTLLPLTDPPDLRQSAWGTFAAHPLLETNLYAVSRTWPAPEMARPGCVWTHTLLIPLNEFERLPNLIPLSSQLRRPDLSIGIKEYEHALLIAPESRETKHELALGIVRSLIFGLYANSHRSVWYRTDQTENAWIAALSLWSQQWPGLRAQFKFCVGPSTPRLLGGELFDLQIAPGKKPRPDQISNGFLLVDDTTQVDIGEPLELLQDDLIQSGYGLREFLWAHGTQTGAGRSAVERLAHLYLAHAQPHAVETHEVVSLLATFPQPTELQDLKRGLLSGGRAWTHDMETQLFLALAAVSGQAFDIKDLRIEQRIGQWGREASSSELEHLLRRTLSGKDNDLKIAMIRGLDLTAIEKLDDLLTALPERSITRLLHHDPSIALADALWRNRIETQVRLWRLLESGRLPEDFHGRFIELSFTYSPEEVIEEVTAKWKAKDWARLIDTARRQHAKPSEPWNRILHNRLPDFLPSLADNVPALRFVASWLNPLNQSVVSVGSGPWLRLATALDREAQRPRDRDAAFLFTLALKDTSRESVELIERSFPILHRVLSEDRVSEQAWQLLDRVLPKSRQGQEWDKCERLRSALLKMVFRRRLPESVLVKAAGDQGTLTALFMQAAQEKKSRKLLPKFIDEILRRSSSLPSEIRHVIEELKGGDGH